MPQYNDSSKAYVDRNNSLFEVQMQADQNGNIHNILDNPSHVGLGDSASVDAFFRLRTSSPVALFENKNVYDANLLRWSQVTAGSGTVAHIANESAVGLSVTTASGDSAIRQSIKYMNYFPGKSQLVYQSFIMAPTQTGLTQRVGYYDASNGMFLSVEDTTVNFVIRSSTSGAAVDTKVAQASWNIDKLDGTGNSGITLDLTKVQILIIDFQDGCGRVRLGFFIDGKIYYAHQFLVSNVGTNFATANSSLPVRFEIFTTSVIGAPATLKEGSSMVSREGGSNEIETQFAADCGITSTATSVTETPIMALRLNKRNGTFPVRSAIELLNVQILNTAANTLYKLYHVSEPYTILPYSTLVGTFTVGETVTDSVTGATGTVISDSGTQLVVQETNEFYFGTNSITGSTSLATATVTAVNNWTAASSDSVAEFATTFAGTWSLTDAGYAPRKLYSEHIPSTTGNQAIGDQLNVNDLNWHKYLYQNYSSVNSQMFLVTAQTTTGSGTAYSSITWMEE